MSQEYILLGIYIKIVLQGLGGSGRSATLTSTSTPRQVVARASRPWEPGIQL